MSVSPESNFLVRDCTSLKTKGTKKRCRVDLTLGPTDEVIFEYCDVKSNAGQKPESITFNEREWLVFFAENRHSETASMAVTKVGALQESLVVEAKFENRIMLNEIEQKLRKNLKVISYDVVIRQSEPKISLSQGVVNIFPDKVLVTQGFPPDLNVIFIQSLDSGGKNEINRVGEQGLWFSSKPDICVFSDHRDNIWRTLEQCLKEFKPSRTASYQSLSRPCCYLYMNVKEAGRENYVNMFSLSDTIYQNWKNNNKTEGDVPPPCPPRRPPPRLPPKPRNRPPNSPLPPVPNRQSGNLFSVQRHVNMREMQFVVYCSKPLIGHFWVIQVIFMQKNDYLTLQRIKNLEEESNYQLLKPLPDHLKITGDFQISIELSKGTGCCLRSDATQRVSFEVVKDVTLQSCWMVIEFHLEHNGPDSGSFHGKITMKPITQDSIMEAKKDVLISANFKNETQHGYMHHVITAGCDSLKSLGVKRYFELCNSLDLHGSVLGKDWMGLAGEVGLTVDEVFKIQSKALFPTFSPTNEVLNIWSQRQYSTCCLSELRNVLVKLQRFDIIRSVLDNSDS